MLPAKRERVKGWRGYLQRGTSCHLLYPPPSPPPPCQRVKKRLPHKKLTGLLRCLPGALRGQPPRVQLFCRRKQVSQHRTKQPTLGDLLIFISTLAVPISITPKKKSKKASKKTLERGSMKTGTALKQGRSAGQQSDDVDNGDHDEPSPTRKPGRGQKNSSQQRRRTFHASYTDFWSQLTLLQDTLQ